MEILEKLVFQYCDLSIVSNTGDKKYIKEKLKVLKSPIVVNSFIDTTKFFYKEDNANESDDFLFIGRLSFEKNLPNIFKAIKKINSSLSIIGEGEEEENLRNLANRIGLKVNFCGIVDNSKLNEELNKHKFFILCSLSEGLPKVFWKQRLPEGYA